MSLVTQLPSGAFTLSGKSSGPATSLGRNRYNKSQLIFMNEAELRHAVSAFSELGFVNPEIHQQVADDLAATTAELDQAHAEIAELTAKLAVLEETVGFKTHAADAREQAALVPELREQLEQALADLEKAQAAPAPKAESKGKSKAKKSKSKSKAKS